MIKDNQHIILFFGEGHGAHAAYLSLIEKFEKVHVLANVDSELEKLVTNKKLLVSAFDEIKPHVAVTAGYRPHIKPEIYKNNPVINIHYALLPRFRGLHSLVWGILNDEPYLGLTMHLVNNKFDAGDIVHQYKVAYQDQTSWNLMMHFDDYVKQKTGSVVKDFLEGKIIPTPQDENQALWCARRNVDDCKIDFTMTVRQLHLLFRALVKPYPLPFIKIKEKNYSVTHHELEKREYNVPVGRILNVDDRGCWVKVNDGFIIIKELEDSQGNHYSADQILKLGQRLN